ncbi:hypothetical protein [Enterococcus casseliflavus]|uniref:SCP domain-containing protein n=1 Tax=Enterococcus casseliflavus TaxID=37734 RepID=A0AAW8UL25_ENTCA|nr:hypothetical protein [Enterococcus casseliflavus]MDB1692903.1 hypothetical protein [Enterococcus casseliflavus]MDT2963120.1 hypothetical protein [Enterococcus casseliflavus]
MKKFLIIVVFGISVLSFGQINGYADENGFEIDETNQSLINEAISNEESNREYIDGVIRMFEDSDSAEEFNASLNESLTVLNSYDAEQDALLEEYKADVAESVDPFYVEPKSKIGARSSVTPANPVYAAAIAAYNKGISMVKKKGHNQTAAYMKHAIISAENYYWNPTWKPSTYVNKNDSWAKTVDGEELMTAYYSRLKKEAFSTGKKSGSFSGSYTFLSGQLHTALRGVSYTVTYKKQANGNYWTQVKVTDIFDFKWELNGYDGNFEVGFGNNYCYAMQRAGFIIPYKIEVIHEVSR